MTLERNWTTLAGCCVRLRCRAQQQRYLLVLSMFLRMRRTIFIEACKPPKSVLGSILLDVRYKSNCSWCLIPLQKNREISPKLPQYAAAFPDSNPCSFHLLPHLNICKLPPRPQTPMRSFTLSTEVLVPRPPPPHLILQFSPQHLYYILTDGWQELPAVEGASRCKVEVQAVRVRGDERVLRRRDGVPTEFGVSWDPRS